MIKAFSILFSLIVLSSCTSTSDKEQTGTQQALFWVEQSWIDERVLMARKRLQDSEAGRKIWRSIESHGGLNTWFANGPISFHFDYRPLDGSKRRDSYQVIDKWSVRAVHEVTENRNWKYGWDGENAWSYPDSIDVGVNPRFWSITPYYFIGLPFVLSDDGVILEDLGLKEYKGKTYDAIKASYESGTGDAPDDFYIVYIDHETGLLGALRYIVSYPGFFPNGGHSPEKLMEVLSNQTVDGITLPTGYHTFWFKDGEATEHITEIDVTEVSFDKSITNSYFDMPTGSKIQDGF